MKRFLQPSFMLIILIAVLSGCTMQKRVYLPGYFVEWNNKKPVSKADEKADNLNSDAEPPETKQNCDKNIADENCASGISYIASAGNSYGLINPDYICPKIYVIPDAARETPVTNDTCDIIVLKEGGEISVKVIEINSEEIKYKKCNYTNGPTVIIKRADVIMIKYPNGTSDNISNDSDDYYKKTTKTGKKTLKKAEDTSVFSFIAAVVGLFVFGIPLGILAVILGILGLNKVSKNRDRYRGEAWAALGIVLGLIDIIAVLLFLSEM